MIVCNAFVRQASNDSSLWIWWCSAARHEREAEPNDNGIDGNEAVRGAFGSTRRVTINDEPWNEKHRFDWSRW